MMILSIASGKGGTGKTTVVTNLAISLGKVQIIDCDVEEPNVNIFLKAKISESEHVKVETPRVNSKCDYCGRCAEFCKYNALAVLPNKVIIFPELCHSCGGCELVCPNNAVEWNERAIGKIDHGSVGDIDFYQGVLKVGEAMATPLIKALKKKVDKNRHVILDSPPGTACPVIETIRGSDFCLLVTEPTPFGLHDLKLAVELVKRMAIPFGVIINRDGIGDEKVERYCQNEKIPILMKISHSEEIAYLYSQGIPFVCELPEWFERFQHLFDRIQQEADIWNS